MLATRIAYWMSLSVLIWVFFGYPLLILALGRYRRDDSRPSLEISELPHVSVLICAHNEERVIEGKIRNSLGLEYPFDKLNIIVVSDGSSDGTNEIAKRFSDRRLTLIAYAKRGGKATAINVGIQFASGDIIVFTDANVLLEPSALRQLVGAFKDFRVCGVVGNVILRAGDGSGDGEGIYSRYEKAIHAAEGNLCTMITVDGALYSLRRKYVGPIPVDTINDDWFLATGALLEGERIVFEPTAIGYEDAAETVAMEFARKVRMVAGGTKRHFEEQNSC